MHIFLSKMLELPIVESKLDSDNFFSSVIKEILFSDINFLKIKNKKINKKR